MILADVNVLIGAFRRDSPEHATCRPWLDEVILSDASFGVSPLALAALVRVTTGRRFFAAPSLLDDAIGFCEDLSLSSLKPSTSSRATAIGPFFGVCASKLVSAGRGSPMPGTRRSPSNGDASGSASIATTRGFQS